MLGKTRRTARAIVLVTASIILSLAPAIAAAQQETHVIQQGDLSPLLLESSPIGTSWHSAPMVSPPPLDLAPRSAPWPRLTANDALCLSFASLEALDVHSTARALGAGHQEGNPMMAGVAGNTVTLIAVKLATTGAVIALDRKLMKQGRRLEATALMVFVNSMSAIIVAHNYRTPGPR